MDLHALAHACRSGLITEITGAFELQWPVQRPSSKCSGILAMQGFIDRDPDDGDECDSAVTLLNVRPFDLTSTILC